MLRMIQSRIQGASVYLRNHQISQSLLDNEEEISSNIKDSNINYECNSLENKINMNQHEDGHILNKDYVNLYDFLKEN